MPDRLNTLLMGLVNQGHVNRDPGEPESTPVPLEHQARVKHRTALLSRKIGGTLEKDEFQRVMDEDPDAARRILEMTQGLPVPQFPMGGLG